jgi:hypothetical protein
VTLPAAPPISLLQIYTEFGAPLNTPLSAMVRGGAWVPNTPQNVNVPTSLPISVLDFLGASASNAAAGPQFTLTQVASIGSSNPQEAALIFAAGTNGAQLLTRTSPGGTTAWAADEWLRPGFSSADYEIRWTTTDGELSVANGVSGVWYDGASGVTYWLRRTTQGEVECRGTIDIRIKATGVIALTRPNILLHAEIS